MKKLILAALFAASTTANADCFLATGVADVVSTEVALSNIRGAVEANPLGYDGMIIAKAATYVGLKFADDKTRETVNKVVCPLQVGLAVNNFAVALGAVGAAPVFGLAAGLLYVSGARFGPVTVTYANPN